LTTLQSCTYKIHALSIAFITTKIQVTIIIHDSMSCKLWNWIIIVMVNIWWTGHFAQQIFNGFDLISETVWYIFYERSNIDKM